MKIREVITESIDSSSDQKIIDDFIAWSVQTLRIQTPPEFTFSKDNPKGESKPHTGAFDPGNNTVWVYIGNRNMVDICRTVFHELVHVRQHELGMVAPGKSYPGSPIEALADMLAGKYIKIYGKKNPAIYQ